MNGAFLVLSSLGSIVGFFLAISDLVCRPGRGGELPLLSRRGNPPHGRVHAGTLGVSTYIFQWYIKMRTQVALASPTNGFLHT